MKKQLKGFTLVELIVVMAIMSIIMIIISSVTKPVLTIANRAKKYDTQRTIAEEITNYVCESVRYAQYAQVYTDMKILPSNAIKNFEKFRTDNGFVVNTSGNANATPPKIQVIAIVNDFNGIGNSGITKGIAVNSYNGAKTPNYYGRVFKKVESKEFYTAMGKWYYDNTRYGYEVSYKDGIFNINTSSYDKDKTRNNPNDDKIGVSAKGTMKFLNYQKEDDPYKKMPPNPIKGSGSNAGKNTYIVYSLKE